MRTPRYNDFTELIAARSSTGCVNGALCSGEIKKGDRIGWSSRFKIACCAPCWASWVAENREAQQYEDRIAQRDGGW